VTGAEFDGVDYDLLADYIGGALAETPDEPVVAALVADDPAWRAAYESLGAGMAFVGAELGRLEPEPMPADLAAELDAMFRMAPASAQSAPAPRLTLVRDDEDVPAPAVKTPPKRIGRRMRWAAPIAIAAGLVAFAGFGADYLVSSDDAGQSDTASNSSAGMPAAGEAEAGSGAARTAADPQILASGADYTQDTLGLPPPQPMSAPELNSTEPKAGADRSDTKAPMLGRLGVKAALDECFGEIERENAAGPITVQSADYARFEGSPALVVRFAADNGQWAWASGPRCGTPDVGADTLGKVPVR
jgi:hypothetical protein